MSQQQSQPGPSEPQPGQSSNPASKQKKRSQIVVACNACRVRKLKCSGDRPSCHSCEAKGLVCVYEADPDVTRNATLKRRYAVLQDSAKSMTELIDLLRYRPLEEAMVIVQQLQQGHEVTAIVHDVLFSNVHVQQQLPQVSTDNPPSQPSADGSGHGGSASRSPEMQQRHRDIELWRARTSQPQQDERMRLETIVLQAEAEHAGKARSTTSQGRRASHSMEASSEGQDAIRFNLSRLSELRPMIDERLTQIRAEQWSLIRVGDDVMAVLLSIYLNTFHKQNRVFDEEEFISAVESSRVVPEMSALVNAVCCYACTQCQASDSYTRSLKPLFHEYTRRLLNVQSMASPKSLAAVTIMATIDVNEGGGTRDHFVRMAADMAQQLENTRRIGTVKSTEHAAQEMIEAQPEVMQELLNSVTKLLGGLSSSAVEG